MNEIKCPTDKQMLDKLRAELLPVLNDICPEYGVDPVLAFDEACRLTNIGRYVYAFNYWHMTGKGDAGYCISMIPLYTGTMINGGITPRVTKIAKYKSLASAIRAYCESRPRP